MIKEEKVTLLVGLLDKIGFMWYTIRMKKFPLINTWFFLSKKASPDMVLVANQVMFQLKLEETPGPVGVSIVGGYRV